MKLILPFPPSVNTYWRNIKGVTLISKSGRAFRANALAAIYEQLRCRPKAIGVPVSVIVRMYPPTLHARDIDNFLKAPFDALTHANVWLDDKQVKKMDVEWCEKVKGGRFEITIEIYHQNNANAVA